MAHRSAPTRKASTLNRLKKRLEEGKQSLADQFEFKMFVAFVFKNKAKKSALFEVSQIITVMTNDYKDKIIKGAKENFYSMDSSINLLRKDIVQFHAPEYRSLRKDVVGCPRNMDFILWPRNDVESIACYLFSRWKDDPTAEFKHLQTSYEIFVEDYASHLNHRASKVKKDMVINNQQQNMFLFLDCQQWQSQNGSAPLFRVTNICLYLPQDQLTLWGTQTVEQVISPHLIST